MSDQDQAKDRGPTITGAEASGDGGEKTEREAGAGGGSRRRFLQGLVSAAPGILTIAGRPAWANRCTFSGNLSGNLSAPDDEACAGEGCSPGFWVTHSDLWHPEFSPDLLFSDVFGVDAFPGLSLFAVISRTDFGLGGFASRCGMQGHGEHNAKNLLLSLGFQAVAALQNAANAVRYELTVADVQRSFLLAYQSCSLERMEETKDALDRLNNRYCPLPWG
ncbi:MAG TPA: hypothetical protein VKA55_07300 [Gammaproteobacteria bacterium]|nr:hypothetical protein [Gammaproteobacteria bacterium]